MAESGRPIERAVALILTVSLVSLMTLGFVLIIVGVMTRYFFNLVIPWSNELIGYIFTWVGFLGVSADFGGRAPVKHIRISLLEDRLPASVGHWWEVGIRVASLFFVCVVGVEGVRFWHLGTHLTSSSMPSIQMSWFYLVVPVASGLAALNLLASIARLLLERDVPA